MNKDKIEFKFTTVDINSIQYSERGTLLGTKDHYTEIFKEYFKAINKKVDNFTLHFYNIGYEKTEENKYVEEDGRYLEGKNLVHTLHPHNKSLLVSGKTTSHANSIFDFYIYSQNNCCGAMTTSKTHISEKYQDKKLGVILQYLKEDIAKTQNISMLLCTDIYYQKYNESKDGPIEKLTPYLPNAKLLLSTGWGIQNLFLNRKSGNVVGIYTKDIPEQKSKPTEIVMKIVPIDEKLIKIENITIGCDPELFFRSKDTKDFVPSFFVMKGNKNNPEVITKDGHNIQCDNVMAEYGVPPSKTAEEFVSHNLLVQNYLKEKVAEPNNLELFIFPSAIFDENNLTQPKAKEFGCDPDYNVWEDGRPNTVGSSKDGLRTAGGHIHVGYDNYNRVTNNYIIKALDLFLSVPLVLMEPNNRRKEMYGKAGAYREQPWGVEYRVTSNYIFSSPELMTWAFNQVQKAITFINEGNTALLDMNVGNILRSINDKDMYSVDYLIKKFDLEVLVEKAEKVLSK